MTDKIVARGIWKSFYSARDRQVVVALQDLNVTIREGEFFSVVGPSGCGKSTFLNLVAGLAVPDRGTLEFNGVPIQGPSPKRGVCFQDYALFPWRTVAENVAFGLKARGVPHRERLARAQRYIELVNLRGFEDRYPHELSGGMRQRCALARLLCTDPEVLLMDEPMAAVDAQTRNILQDELLRIWGEELQVSGKKTVMYITHNIEEAVYLSDRIMVMSRRPGRVKEIVDNSFPRPRVDFRKTSDFREQVERIWALIRDEAYTATFA